MTIDYLSLVEANTGIVCACVMTMKPLLSRLGGGTTRGGGRDQDDSNPDQLGPVLFSPPTIGSKPSRACTAPAGSAAGGLAVGVLSKKQSWFSAQLARLDRSLQTVNEDANSCRTDAAGGGVRCHSPGMLEAGAGGCGTPPRRPSLVAMLLQVPLRAHLPVPRLSHHSSIITTHVDQEEADADAGPLEQARYARRSSCAV